MTDTQTDTMEIDLVVLIHTLLRRLHLILLAALIAGSTAFYISSYHIQPIYQADALMYVNNSALSLSNGKISISPGELDAAQSLVDTYAIIAKSRNTLNRVIAKAGLSYSYGQLNSMVSASPVNATEIFKISVRSSDPEEAEFIANTIAEVLPETISEIVDGSSVRIVDYAVVPSAKVSPSILKNTILGALLGGILSSGIVVLFALFNDVIRGKDDLLDSYNISILAVVPRLSSYSEYSDQSKIKNGYGGRYEKASKKQ